MYPKLKKSLLAIVLLASLPCIILHAEDKPSTDAKSQQDIVKTEDNSSKPDATKVSQATGDENDNTISWDSDTSSMSLQATNATRIKEDLAAITKSLAQKQAALKKINEEIRNDEGKVKRAHANYVAQLHHPDGREKAIKDLESELNKIKAENSLPKKAAELKPYNDKISEAKEKLQNTQLSENEKKDLQNAIEKTQAKIEEALSTKKINELEEKIEILKHPKEIFEKEQKDFEGRMTKKAALKDEIKAEEETKKDLEEELKKYGSSSRIKSAKESAKKQTSKLVKRYLDFVRRSKTNQLFAWLAGTAAAAGLSYALYKYIKNRDMKEEASKGVDSIQKLYVITRPNN